MVKGLVTAIIFGLAISLFFMLVLPRYDEIKLAKATLTERQDLFSKYESAVKTLSDLNNQYDRQKTNVDKLAVLLPRFEQADQIVYSVQEIADQSGIQVKSLSISDVTSVETDAIKKKTISLDVFCNYDALVNFLSNIEDNLRLSDVTRLSVSKQSGNQYLSVSIGLTVYYLEKYGE